MQLYDQFAKIKRRHLPIDVVPVEQLMPGMIFIDAMKAAQAKVSEFKCVTDSDGCKLWHTLSTLNAMNATHLLMLDYCFVNEHCYRWQSCAKRLLQS